MAGAFFFIFISRIRSRLGSPHRANSADRLPPRVVLRPLSRNRGRRNLMRSPEPADDKLRTSALTTVALLWLAGNGMRLTILAVPPLIPLIDRGLHMSGTAVGLLCSLPAVSFACADLPGSLLVARLLAGT